MPAKCSVCRCAQVSFRTLSFPRQSFDVVTMYHALEHVEDPLAILSRLRAWIVDKGVLFIEVPNVEARCIAPSHRFHFAHFYNFNRMTLEALGRKAGFEPVQTTTSPDGGNLISVFRAGPRASRADRSGELRTYRRGRAASHGVEVLLSRRFPYTGPLGRLRTYLADRALGADTEQVLENAPTQVRLPPKSIPTVGRSVSCADSEQNEQSDGVRNTGRVRVSSGRSAPATSSITDSTIGRSGFSCSSSRLDH